MRTICCLALLLSACASNEIKLGPEWAPLEKVRESKVMAAGLSDAGARCIGDTVYVKSIEEWIPEGALRDATLAHEQVHAQRQADQGLLSWLSSYATSERFAWDEEQLGWYAQIQYLRGRGLNVNPAAVANALAKYKGPWGQMVDEKDARKWVDDVLAGRWKPGSK